MFSRSNGRAVTDKLLSLKLLNPGSAGNPVLGHPAGRFVEPPDHHPPQFRTVEARALGQNAEGGREGREGLELQGLDESSLTFKLYKDSKGSELCSKAQDNWVPGRFSRWALPLAGN